jgi:putative ABC transport system permease protein
MLSHEFWQRRFAAERTLIDSTIQLDDTLYTVVGVLPPTQGMPFVGDVDVWLPKIYSPAELSEKGRTLRRGRVLARMVPDLKVAQAQAEMELIAQQLAQEYPSNESWGARVIPLREQILGNIATTLWILLGAVAFVLLIACANVINLLLSRSAERQREIALRTALGCGRWRLIRQFLTEAVLLSLLGGAGGLMLAFLGTRLLSTLGPSNVPRLEEVAIDGRVLLFTLAASLGVGILFGLIPALRASKVDLSGTLKEGGKSTGGRREHLLRNGLVVLETATVLLLLIGAGLMIKSFWELRRVDPGFQVDERLVMQVVLPKTKYPDKPQIMRFFAQVEEQIEDIPGVREVGSVSTFPFTRAGLGLAFFIEGQPAPAPGEMRSAGYDFATAGYFQALGIPKLQGRHFREGDHEEAPTVMVINRTMAEQFWPDQDPVGTRLSLDSADGPWIEIVGIVDDVKHQGLDASVRPEMYQPHSQLRFPWPTMNIVVHTEGRDPLALAGELRSAVWRVDPDQGIAFLRTVEDIVEASVAEQRSTMLLLGLFALVALLLGSLGIYGVVNYSVTQRTQEIGVRLSLGAYRTDILRWILGKGLLPIALGIVVGIGAALLLGRVLESQLFEVTTTDPIIYALLCLVLLAVALLAILIPARRASRVDPVVALKYD